MKRIPLYVFLFSLLSLASFAQDDPTVYVTRTGKKYHTAGCLYLRSSSIPMKLSEASLQYSPCSRCNPPTMGSNEGQTATRTAGVAKSTSREASSVDHSSENAVGTTLTGKTIYEGPRGGHYHYSKSGRKVYEKRKH